MSVGRGLDIRIVDSLNFLPTETRSPTQGICPDGAQEGLVSSLIQYERKPKLHRHYNFPDMYYYGVDYLSSKE